MKMCIRCLRVRYRRITSGRSASYGLLGVMTLDVVSSSLGVCFQKRDNHRPMQRRL